jgi:hypothetical protein
LEDSIALFIIVFHFVVFFENNILLMLELGILLYMGGLISLGLGINFILRILLSLEYMIVRMFFIIIMLMDQLNIEFFVFFIVISVCEARLGLGLLVLGIISGGNKLFKSINLLIW